MSDPADAFLLEIFVRITYLPRFPCEKMNLCAEYWECRYIFYVKFDFCYNTLIFSIGESCVTSETFITIVVCDKKTIYMLFYPFRTNLIGVRITV